MTLIPNQYKQVEKQEEPDLPKKNKQKQPLSMVEMKEKSLRQIA